MKYLIVGALLFSIDASAFAQTAQAPAPPAAGKNLAHAKPAAPSGCKLVGTVRGTKLWAGDCVANSAATDTEAANPGPTQSSSRPIDPPRL
jgi:hypothetical protein